MILAPEDAALFYRAWWPLLTWVNDQRSIVPRFPRPSPDRPIGTALAKPIRDALWADDSLLEKFLTDGATELGVAERELVASWKDRVSGQFVVLKHLQKHSIFMSKDVFGVVGIYSPLQELIPHVPMFVDAVLLPFGDRIIIDGLLSSPGIQLSFGPGARRAFQEQYRKAQATSQVRTSLLPRAEPRKQVVASRSSSSRPQLRGEWRITTTELWDADALNMVQPAFIRFDDDRFGAVGMIAAQASLDCRYAVRDGKALVEFTFAGDDDGDPWFGRGWATLEKDGSLQGRLFSHHGDDSDFVAERVTTKTRAPQSRAKRRTRKPRF
ncbi:MAG: hypothetical protein JWP01_2585 [Myxococcales bacterium]|nr:hypothetical protein [Myxococcales bacterium]